MLRVDDLRVTVGGDLEAVREVSLTLGPGEALGLVGESGSGKTLTCRAVLGVLPPGAAVAGGRVTLGEVELTSLDRKGWDRVRGGRIGAVFQDPASYLNPSLTVGRQLAEQLRLKRGLPRKATRAAAVDLLAAMGIRRPEAVHDQYPHELSGGMLQRALIAIAVAGEPELLVADEATTALDPAVQAEVLELLGDLRARRGLALLLVSHDLAVVAEVCDRVAVFYAGQIVEQGPTASVIANPRHPYTAALLRVASLGDWRRRELEVIPGRPPSVGASGPGCAFAERCAHAAEGCAAPVPLSIVDDRVVRCHRAGELALAGA
ncbi:ABC transporter ATP-binding protein [Dactylosporangium sp. NPDC051485]|uniref:ABC transporter ATP-binding protein n=1 Tax=Dactylosporangium sp. NPDC051485 TaxID=3154846 RepID=UPI003431AAA3